MIVIDDVDLVNLFKDALQQQRIETYASTDSSQAMKKIKASPRLFSTIFDIPLILFPKIE